MTDNTIIKPLVAVVNINYNQSQMTIECNNSILKSDYPNFTIIIIDNGSTEENYKILVAEYEINPKVKLIRIVDNVGYVKGVNRGIEEAINLNAEYIQIMNNDTLIDLNAVSILVDTCKRYDNKAIVSGKVYHFDRPDTLQYIGHYFKNRNTLLEFFPGKNEIDKGQFDEEKERDMLDDIFWLFHSKLIEDIGYYNTAFFLYAEQADYALRAVRSGYKLVYTPTAKLWHKGSLTTGGGIRNSPVVNFWRFKSSVIFLYLHLKKHYFYYMLFRKIIILIKNYLKFLVTNKSVELKSLQAAITGTFYGIKWIFNKVEDNGYNPYIGKK